MNRRFPLQIQGIMVMTLIGLTFFLALVINDPTEFGVAFSTPCPIFIMSYLINNLSLKLQQNQEDPQIDLSVPKLSPSEEHTIRRLIILFYFLLLFPIGYLSYFLYNYDLLESIKIVWPVLYVSYIIYATRQIRKYIAMETK